MLIRTGEELAKKFWKISDDTVAVQYWTYEDVLDFVEGDTYYGEVTENVAREVWGAVAVRLMRLEIVDNDVVRDEISAEFDKRMGAE